MGLFSVLSYCERWQLHWSLERAGGSVFSVVLSCTILGPAGRHSRGIPVRIFHVCTSHRWIQGSRSGTPLILNHSTTYVRDHIHAPANLLPGKPTFIVARTHIHTHTRKHVKLFSPNNMFSDTQKIRRKMPNAPADVWRRQECGHAVFCCYTQSTCPYSSVCMCMYTRIYEYTQFTGDHMAWWKIHTRF